MIGRIIRSHGVRGEMKVVPETDDPARLLELESVFVGENEDAAVQYDVTMARTQQSKKGIVVLMSLAGVDGRDAADALRHQSVFAAQNELPPLEEGEYYLHDLVDCDVETVEGDHVGRLKEVMELPAQNIYVIARTGKPDVMVPAVPAFIEKVDVDANRIVINSIDGLLDP